MLIDGKVKNVVISTYSVKKHHLHLVLELLWRMCHTKFSYGARFARRSLKALPTCVRITAGPAGWL